VSSSAAEQSSLGSYLRGTNANGVVNVSRKRRSANMIFSDTRMCMNVLIGYTVLLLSSALYNEHVIGVI